MPIQGVRSLVAAALAVGLFSSSSLNAQFPVCAGPTADMLGSEDDGLQDDSRASGPSRALITAIPSDAPRDASAYFRPLRPEPKTLEALRKPVTLEYIDQPLERLLVEFERQTGAPFFLDETGLEEAAITSDTEVTFRADGMTAATALQLFLHDLDLEYLAYDEYVLVTSRETSTATRETRTYALVDHPLLRGEDALRFARAVREHVELTGSVYYEESFAADILPGALVITADRRSLEAAEAFLRQYATVLAEYDAAQPANGSE